jgi:hypothetical protein
VHVNALNRRYREEGTRKKGKEMRSKTRQEREKSTGENVQMKQYKNKKGGIDILILIYLSTAIG